MTETAQQICVRVHKDYVALNTTDAQKQRQFITQLLDFLVKSLKQQNSLFAHLFQNLSFSGSFYEGLKVSVPNESDVLFNFHFRGVNIKLFEVNTYNCKAGYVSIEGFATALKTMPPEWKSFATAMEKWCDARGSLLPGKVQSWFKGQIDSFVCRQKEMLFTRFNITSVIVSRTGPAATLKIGHQNGVDIDIDLVPCIQLTHLVPPRPIKPLPVNGIPWGVVPKTKPRLGKKKKTNLPQKSNSQKSNSPNSSGNNVVMKETGKEWRLSFNFHEQNLISGKGYLKPAIRMLKRLRDVRNWNLTSYHLKTVALWALEDHNWDSLDLYETFIILLKRLAHHLNQNSLPFFWDRRLNLFKGSVKKDTSLVLKNTILILIKKIDRDPREIETALAGN